MKCIGIDIGSFSVKVFTVEAKNKEIQLLDYQEYALATEPTADNRVLIVDILRQLTEQNDPNSTKYIFSLPQNQVSSRNKMFPFKERSKVLKTIPFELEDEIPFDLEESVFDAKFVRFLGPTAEVIASATPKKNVLDLLEIAQSVGIDPDIVSSQGVALSNLVEDFNNAPPSEDAPPDSGDDDDDGSLQQPPAPGHAIVSIGHSTSIVSVYREFRLVALRTIDWGGADIAADIAGRYRIQPEEALKELQSKAFILTNTEGASKDQIIFSETISGSFAPMTRDLKLFLLNTTTEFNIELSHLALTGGASQIRNLSSYLSEQVGIPASTFDIFERFPAVHMELTPEVRSSSGSALALAIEGIKRPANPATNFRKDELAKQSKTFQLFWNQWGQTVRIAAIALLCLYVYAFVKSYLADEAALASNSKLRRQAKTLGLRGSQARPRGIRRYVNSKKKEIKNRAALVEMTAMNSALDLVSQLSRSVPGKSKLALNIHSFEIVNQNLTLAGNVADPSQLRALELSLKALAVNGKVRSNNPPARAGSRNVEFRYSLLVDRKFPKKAKRRPRGKK